MKRGSKHRGGGRRPGEQRFTEYRQGADKIFAQKRVTKLTKAKVKRITARRIGCEAASDKLTSEELCQDIASKAVQMIIARRKQWKPRRASGCGYTEIATELCFLPLPSLEKLCSSIDDLMREYILAFLDGDHDRFKLPGGLLRSLGKEYIRDHATLKWFLSAVLQRRRNLGGPDSPRRVRLVTQQLASRYGHNRKRLLDELQKRSVVPNNLTITNQDSWLNRIGQWLSRDQRAATGKDFGFRPRPKPGSFGALLKLDPKREAR
jgi:hypothetical protein